MKVYVICDTCTRVVREIDEDAERTEFHLDGPLSLNKEHRIETQSYRCLSCHHEVTVSIHYNE